jgi:pyruvate formate lyase activating enzyme
MGARQICGKERTSDEVFAELVKDKPYYKDSGGGVTFSGGECMLQPDFLLELLKACKNEGIHTAVDTAGYVAFENFEKILPCTDLFLYDIKAFDPIKHKEWTGVRNELILSNLKKLLGIGVKIWVRIPVIASINDSAEEMLKIREFFDKYGPRIAHLNALVQTLSVLGSVPTR